MPNRTVVEWDKDDLDALGILKVDCLGLGMLTAIRKCFDLIASHLPRWGRLRVLPSCADGSLPHETDRNFCPTLRHTRA